MAKSNKELIDSCPIHKTSSRWPKDSKVCWAIANAVRLISARAYHGFYSIKQLVSLPLDGMLVHLSALGFAVLLKDTPVLSPVRVNWGKIT